MWAVQAAMATVVGSFAPISQPSFRKPRSGYPESILRHVDSGFASFARAPE
jgi:hypothetical protein